MKWIKLILCSVFCLGVLVALAQTATNSSGDNLQGSSGTVAYSVGQFAISTYSSENGKVQEGVQQAYVVSDESMGFQLSSTINCKVFPNPVAHQINIEIHEEKLSGFAIKLFDLNGKQILAKEISSAQSIIPVKNYNSGSYLLIISKNNIDQKIFKVIKN